MAQVAAHLADGSKETQKGEQNPKERKKKKNKNKHFVRVDLRKWKPEGASSLPNQRADEPPGGPDRSHR